MDSFCITKEPNQQVVISVQDSTWLTEQMSLCPRLPSIRNQGKDLLFPLLTLTFPHHTFPQGPKAGDFLSS